MKSIVPANRNTRSGISGEIEKERKQAEELDVLISGRVNQLVLDGEITNEMATSLMNDSDEAGKIVRDLVDITTLLYYPRDKLMDQIEEEKLEGA